MNPLPSTALLLLSLVTLSVAQPSPLVIPKDDLTAFTDGMFDIQLKRDDAAGAVLLLTQNGTTLLSQGYGLADIRQRIPMSDHTIVRGGALTMPVIAVAVMQQVEAGKLSLDADISLYLDLPIPPGPGGPITLRELLTHTAGFAGAPTPTPKPAPPYDLRTWLTSHPPARIYPAGAVTSFSPYGMALAAYIVQRVSGESFADYTRNRIFRPLGMAGTTLLQPLPPSLLPALSQGYGPSTLPPLPPEALQPALSLSTTATDMGRFGAMLLNRGLLDGQHILTPDSVAAILSRQTSVAPDLSPQIPGMGLAFHQIWFNGSRYFGQSGDTEAFHTEFEVDPQRRLVLFLAYNSTGHPAAPGEVSKLTAFSRGELIHGIFDRYQPFHPTAAGIVPSAAEQSLATGAWIPADEVGLPLTPSHVLHSSIDPASHSLVIDRFVSDRGTVKHWPMLLPGLWQQFPQDRIQVIPGRNGLPDRLALASDPANQMVRLSQKRVQAQNVRQQRPPTSPQAPGTAAKDRTQSTRPQT